jgi:hypothetical protein
MENTYLTRISRLVTLPGSTSLTHRVCRLVHRGEHSALAVQEQPLGGCTSYEGTPEDELYTYFKLPSSFAHASRVQRGTKGVSKFMALVSCTQGVALLELPQVEDAGIREYLKSVIVAPTLHSWGMFPALDLKWHPLSGSHFLTLSVDGVRVWNAEKLLYHGVDEHHHTDTGGMEYELLFPWMGTHTSPPISLTFGDIGRGWEGLSVFITCQNGSLFCICPLLPRGASLSSEAMGLLRSTSPNAFASQWLSDNFTVEAGGSMDYTPIHTPLPALQGPLQTPEEKTDPSSVFSFTCDAIVYPSSLCPLLTAIGLLRADGKFSVLLSPEPVLPCWFSTEEGSHVCSRGVVSSEPMVLIPFGVSNHQKYSSFSASDLSMVDTFECYPWITSCAWDFALGDPVKYAVERLRRKAGTFVGGQGEEGTGKREHLGGRVVEPEIMGVPWLMCAGSNSSPLCPFSTSSSLLLVVHSGGVVAAPLHAHSLSHFASYFFNPCNTTPDLCIRGLPKFSPLDLILPSSSADVVGVELLFSEDGPTLIYWLVDKWCWAGRKGFSVSGKIISSSLPISLALVSTAPLSQIRSEAVRDDEISASFNLLWASASGSFKSSSQAKYDDLMASALSLRVPSFHNYRLDSFTSLGDFEISGLCAQIISDVESSGDATVALSMAINERFSLCRKACDVFTVRLSALLRRVSVLLAGAGCVLLAGAGVANVRAEMTKRRSESEIRVKRLHTLLFDLATMHCAVVDKKGHSVHHGALGAATLAEELAFNELSALRQAAQLRCGGDSGAALYDLESRAQALTLLSVDQVDCCNKSALQEAQNVLLKVREELRE